MDDALRKFLDATAAGKLAELDDTTINELRQRFPYFALPAQIQARRSAEAKPYAAITMPDALNPDASGDERTFYPPEHIETMTTDNAIDTFIETYGNGSENNSKEMALLERLIFNPTPDYSQVLEQQSAELPSTPPVTQGSHDDLIDRFLASHPMEPTMTASASDIKDSAESGSNDNKPCPSDESLLSESLARIYIKRGRYSKAFEIISGLSLNFPEKSVYFADQLRFLQKLILIEQMKMKSQSTRKE